MGVSERMSVWNMNEDPCGWVTLNLLSRAVGQLKGKGGPAGGPEIRRKEMAKKWGI